VDRIKRLFRYFWISGCIGMAVTLLLYLLGNLSYTRAFTVHVATVLSPEMFPGTCRADIAYSNSTSTNLRLWDKLPSVWTVRSAFVGGMVAVSV
jgi:hypothetical protein